MIKFIKFIKKRDFDEQRTRISKERNCHFKKMQSQKRFEVV